MSSDTSKRYAQRGVSASKEDVHNAIKNIDKGLFPKAFCKIVPDYLTGSEDHCLVMHADGAGTKSSLAYMYWKLYLKRDDIRAIKAQRDRTPVAMLQVIPAFF